ncbi:MAG: imidazole glycerol phosphate synthase subunit HisF [Candidatus Marinimicrobia bacterium]|nr:imidazole glycerol phosphate synthase subunit HisF [Candidatus Neomarinimicrobiota bacterium]
MLARRIIPCLDVRDGKVVKGVRFRDHKIVGDIVPLAEYYSQAGADELVFYDITASSDGRSVDRSWIERVARVIDIPFCVAGGISTLETAGEVLEMGADKISINSPALNDPGLIFELNERFGQQCVVVGIDSYQDQETGEYMVYKYTGDVERTQQTEWKTFDWINAVQQQGAGEIVLNCMNQDGVRKGYDTMQLSMARLNCSIPLIASGGAGSIEHFKQVFQTSEVDGALAASVFHSREIEIRDLKRYLAESGVEVRL